MRSLFPLVTAVVFFACVAPLAAEPRFEVAFESLKFNRPLLLTANVETPGTLVVIEQAGRISWFENRPDVTQDDVNVALDISGDKVLREGNEEGLLGFAFHPRFDENHQVFLHYSAHDPRRNVLSRWRWEHGRIDPDSEEILLEVPQPWSNHNGGHLAFGPRDGYLYITLGDGGSGGDPKNAGQRLDTLLGKILRIDVDQTADGKPYAIPPDNPFVRQADALPEIWAYGLRNVWRFSFDPVTGELWAGDVGQSTFEEIDIIVRGGNYGWRVREGFAPFRGKEDSPTPPGMIDPVIQYPRGDGVSVTGGYVYRGELIPSLRGAYIYGDFATGHIWALRRTDDGPPQNTRIGFVPALSSFGVDEHGELYACSFTKHIYKLVP